MVTTSPTRSMRTASATRYPPAVARSLSRTVSVPPLTSKGPPSCCHQAPRSLRSAGDTRWSTVAEPSVDCAGEDGVVRVGGAVAVGIPGGPDLVLARGQGGERPRCRLRAGAGLLVQHVGLVSGAGVGLPARGGGEAGVAVVDDFDLRDGDLKGRRERVLRVLAGGAVLILVHQPAEIILDAGPDVQGVGAQRDLGGEVDLERDGVDLRDGRRGDRAVRPVDRDRAGERSELNRRIERHRNLGDGAVDDSARARRHDARAGGVGVDGRIGVDHAAGDRHA